MHSLLSRRAFTGLALSTAFLGLSPLRAQTEPSRRRDGAGGQAEAALAALEARHGGRLGVVAVETGAGHRIAYRADERFAMCSTHKVLTAAAILRKVDVGELDLDRRVPYGPADMLEYAPITRQHLSTGIMTVGELCAAALQWSDNTAANLLLQLIDGPAGWTRFARAIGDTVSRLDRNEPTLNTAIAGDPRDTTSPAAMVRDLDLVLRGRVLSEGSRQRLETWMLDGKVTGPLLHAGVPKDWRVADKSGSGENGTRNDIGLILPPAPRAPILVAVYHTGTTEPPAARDALIAEVGRILAQAFA